MPRRRTPNELLAGFARFALAAYRGQSAPYRFARLVERNLFRPREELLTEQDRAIAAIVNHAYDNSAFYRRRFTDVGFKPGDVRSRHDLIHLPQITKADLIDNLDDILCAPKDQLLPNTTGGTTGIAMLFYRDTRCLAFRRGIDLATARYYGWRDGQWQGWLWGAERDSIKPRGLKAKLIQRWGDRSFFFNALHISTASYADFIAQTRKYRPTYVSAYPSLAFDLASRIESGELEPVRVPVVSLTAEPTHDFQRRKICRYFADEVFERYGSRETGMAALECPAHEGMHYFTESVHFESEPRVPDAPGDSLLVTDLLNYGMPFIRYQVGDYAELVDEPCDCGRQTPRLRRICGRQVDTVWCPDGHGISGMMIVSFIRKAQIHVPVQIIQETPYHMVVRVEDTFGSWAAELRRLKESLHREIGADVQFDVTWVDHIERAASGKFRYVISRVSSPAV